jgi:DNA invertase Pin-like site-specific DNA recombinase
MVETKFVAYYRVSTKRQGASGLGLEAQREAVADYLRRNTGKLTAEFTEVESGKLRNRPMLDAALLECRLTGATLLVAKLDRLARNVLFTSTLMKSEVAFIAVDFPKANNLTIHILAAVAEHEAEAISLRTKDALAAAKRRGVKLGGDRGMNIGQHAAAGAAASAIARVAKAAAKRPDFLVRIHKIQAEGATSLRQIAVVLNAGGIETMRKGNGHKWTAMQVKRVLDAA